MQRFFWGPFLSILLLSTAHAQVDPSIDWKVLESEHFEVIYNAKYHSVAEEYMRQAERAHALLQPIFQESPDKTVIVIDDGTDETNGLATAIPQPIISLHPALPHPNDSLDHYGNWAQGLVTHEYTHILNFEPTHGWLKPFRWIFGSIVRPNAILPRWYLEGLAVESESRFTHHGRLRSPLYGAMVRALVREGTWGQDDISQINEVRTPYWPSGMRPYFYGALLWQDLVNTKGTNQIFDFNQRYSGRLPFFINAPIEEASGKDWQGYLDDFYKRRAAVARLEIDQLKAGGGAASEPVSPRPETYSQRGVSLSPNGLHLVFVNESFHDSNQVLIRTRKSLKQPFAKGEAKVLLAKDDIHRISWLPDSSGFVFDAVDTFNRYYSYSDLYRYDLKSRSMTRLTRGLRAREPSVSADGWQIAFVRLEPGGTSLARIDIDGSHLAILFQPPPQHRVAGPTFISTNEIVFTERNLEGVEISRSYNLATQKLEPFNLGIAQAKVVGSTRKGLLVTSDVTGTSNLYYRNLATGKVIALTNSQTTIADGAWDEPASTIYATELTGHGSEVVAISAHRLPKSVPGLSSHASGEWVTIPEPTLNYKTIDENYSGLGYLIPKYWIPFFSFLPNGFLVQGNIHANDPLLKHSYDLNVGYDTLTQRASVAFAYENRVTPLTGVLRASDVYTYLYANSQVIRNTQYSAGADFFIPGLSNSWHGSLAWNYANSENPNLIGGTTRAGPSVGLSASNTARKALQVAPENQGEAAANYTQFLKAAGNYEYGQTQFAGAYYFSKWIPQHHVVALKTEAFFTPDNRSILLGTAVGGAEYSASLLKSHYVIRGYPSGEFLAWSMIASNLEYIFPISYRFTGYDVKPIFLRSLSGALVADAATLTGGYYDSRFNQLLRTNIGNFFWGAGGELRADVNVFYHLPGLIRFGLYYGFDTKAYGGVAPYLGIGVEGF